MSRFFTIIHDSFTDLIPNTSSRLPLNTQTFVSNLLPVIVSYYVTAVFVILPGTFPLRLALLPLTLWLVFRAFTSIDVVGSDPGYGYLGYTFGVGMIYLSMRLTGWTFHRKPLKRLPLNELGGPRMNGGTHGHIKSSEANLTSISGVLWDACDLFCNLRGHGWNWAQGWRFPSETRPTSSTATFVGLALLSAFKHFLLFDLVLTVIRSFSPSTFGSSVGGTIYDPSLPMFFRYARSTFISLISGFAIYAPIQMTYDVLTVVGILIFRQHPAQWPPLFDSPWFSTSLTAYWSNGWHQLFRDGFISVGAKPLSFFVGRVGGVMGAFFCSAVMHDWGLWAMGRGTDFWNVGGFFLVMGVGCVLEALFKRATGLKVGGWVGWFWTMSWIVGWANIYMDAYARKGLVGSKFIPEEYMPSQILLSYIFA